MTTRRQPSHRVAERVDSLERSTIRHMFDQANQSDRDDLIHLEIGEPDFDTPAHVVDRAASAARDGATHYTSNAGLVDLREAVADTITAEGTRLYDPASEIVITVGAMESLHLALQAITERDNEVLIPSPAWPNYHTQSVLAGGQPVEVPLDTETGFQLDVDAVINAISDRTAAILLCSPSNPTGQVLDANDIRTISEVAAKHDAYVIADEVYNGLVYDEPKERIASQAVDQRYVLTVGSVSKKYAMTGWRVGWLAGPSDVINAVTKIHESTTACAPAPSQHAALAAITGDQAPINEMKDEFHSRRDYVYNRIKGIDGISCPKPEGAFYAFVNVRSQTTDSVEFAERLLHNYGVVVAPGSGFGPGGEGFVRLSFAAGRSQLETGLDRLERMVVNNS